MGTASATSLAANQLTPGDAGVGGRGSIEQRGFDETLTLIARLEAVTLSMIETIQVTSRVWEWETDYLRTPFINANAGFTVADYSASGPSSFTPTARTVLQNYSQVWIRQIVTEGTLRREQTNTGDEHEYQVEEKEAIALGRDINSSLLWQAGVQGIATSNSRVAGGIASYAGNIWLGAGGSGTGGTAAVWNYQTVAYTQATPGGAVTATGTTTGTAISTNTVVNRLGPNITYGNPGFAGGTNVPVMTTASVAGTGGYAYEMFSRKLLSSTLASVFDVGGLPTNISTSPGVRAVFTEVIARGVNAGSDLYRVTMSSNEEIKNTTSVFITDFGFRLRVDTDQQLRNYATAGGGSPGAVPQLGFENAASRLIAYNPKNIKFGVITPVTRNDDIPQPIYGASSGLVAEGTFVFYNPNDILEMRNINPDINSSQYPT